jgi:serine/threonine protein kinase/Flp pilus assembly protein TadD
MATWDPRANELFLKALELSSAAERRAFLDRECVDYPELRAEVDSLLEAGERAGQFLEQPVADSVATGAFQSASVAEPTETAGTAIGPYKLIEVIGEGGMGTVWLAQQSEPVKRLVALKLIKPGMDSRQVLARFEAERQALAIMDHPHIARVLDAGATAAGRPYFVMELVKGVPITHFCDERHLTPRERLELFIPVCQAIQHAHQKGVIHRDVKPSNVLVALYDGQPVPKVIDFGVAKAAGQPLTEKTLVTGLGTVVGTPEYMSPEQAELNQLDVDTRSDIYSLGVLLYELLTGTTPLLRKRVKEGALLEILRIIREEEPPRPSTRLSTTDQLPSIAANRGLEPRKLSGLVRGELDWIVMKCLEKDRNRRYETANGLAMDLRRFLSDEPVHAGPPTARYRFRKFARRNKRSLLMAGVVGVAVLVSIAGLAASAGWVVRDRTNRLAFTAQQVDHALQDAEALYRDGNYPTALVAAQKAQDLIDSVGGDDELRDRVRQWIKDLKMVARLEEARMLDPAVRGATLNKSEPGAEFAAAFRDYGLDIESPDVEETGRRIRARPIYISLAAAMDDWAAERLKEPSPGPDWRHLLAVAKAADPDPVRVKVRDSLLQHDGNPIMRLVESGEIERLPVTSVQFVGRALRLGGAINHATALMRDAQRRHPDNFWINHELAKCLYHATKPEFDEAIGYYRAAIALRPTSPIAHLNLGLALRDRGRAEEAIFECRRAIELKPGYAEAHSDLGTIYHGKKQFDQAIACYREAIRLKPSLVQPQSNIGAALFDKRQIDDAIVVLRDVVNKFPDYANAHANLGFAYALKSQWPEAIVESHELVRLSPNDPMPHYYLGYRLQANGQFTEALSEMRRAHELASKTPGWNQPSAKWVRDCERLLELEREMPAALRQEPPVPPASKLMDFGGVCFMKQWFGAAATFFDRAINAERSWMEAPTFNRRYEAACAAVLAGGPRDKGPDKFDTAARGKFRQKALTWLRIELAARQKLFEQSSDKVRITTRTTMQHWQIDLNLATVRDPAELNHLSEVERRPWQQLWADVERLRQRAESEK